MKNDTFKVEEEKKRAEEEARRMGVASELLDRLFEVTEEESPEADAPVPGEYHFVFFA